MTATWTTESEPVIEFAVPFRAAIWAITDTGRHVLLDGDSTSVLDDFSDRDLTVLDALIELAARRVRTAHTRRVLGVQNPTAAAASTTDGGL